MPLIFPKVIENTEYAAENNVYIDIGYMHTTVVFESKNEIIAFETFPLWTRSLIDSFSLHHPRLSLIEIEHILFQKKIESSENDLKTICTTNIREIGSGLDIIFNNALDLTLYPLMEDSLRNYLTADQTETNFKFIKQEKNLGD